MQWLQQAVFCCSVQQIQQHLATRQHNPDTVHFRSPTSGMPQYSQGNMTQQTLTLYVTIHDMLAGVCILVVTHAHAADSVYWRHDVKRQPRAKGACESMGGP